MKERWRRQWLSLFCIMIFVLGLFAGCSPKEVPETGTTDTDRTVTLSEIGLKYTTPDAWRAYETVNLYPRTYQTDEVLAVVEYNFISEENLQELDQKSPAITMQEALKPICAVAVLKKENLETAGVQNLFSAYEKTEQAGEEQGYLYIALTGYTKDLSDMSEEDKEIYDKLAAAAPELAASIETSAFDPEAFLKKNEALPNALSFQTETLYGEAIDSTVFKKGKITMLNFGATYAYDESAELQRLYELLKDKKDFQLLTAYIDTPEATTNVEGTKMREAAKATYDTLVLDEALANWVTSNLQGVPTTIFVNAEGIIVGEQLQGSKTAEEYLKAIEDIAKQVS